MGDKFRGIIRKVRVLNNLNCLNTQPQTLTWDTTACTNTAGETCDFCDTVDSCYGNCANISHYYDTSEGCKCKNK